jgi:hypothetical protein
MRPLYAIQAVLAEHGKPMHVAELAKILLDGGITLGKKRGKYNIDVSIRLTVKNGSLIQHGDMIGLPEWETTRLD